MITLPNGCRCSEINVSPKDWETTTEITPWRFHYRFYDPNFRDNTGKIIGHQVKFNADINRIKDLPERRKVARIIIADELKRLKEFGYNPVTGTMEAEEEIDYEIHPDTPLMKALEKAREKLKVVHDMMIDIKSALKTMNKAAAQLRYDSISVGNARRRHLIRLLEQCAIINPRWSNRRHNMYRSYLIMLFKVLQRMEAAQDINWTLIEILPETKKIKRVLTQEERNKIKEHLQVKFPRFLAFVHLFFHSGGRKTELLQQKPATVDLKRQVYRAVVKKGKQFVGVERTIKDVALPYWKLFLEDAAADNFLFGNGFMPGSSPIYKGTISKYWRMLIKWPKEKGGLGINVDFYKLKHLHTTEIVDLMGAEEGTKAAAEHNAHKGTGMIVSIYDTKHQERKHYKIKRLRNEF